MGCSHSAPDAQRLVFKARNLNDKDRPVNTVMIEIQDATIVVRSMARKVMAKWPIACIRRYGYNKHNILFIETGSGCETGQGMYLFKCARTEQVFQLVKGHWEELQRANDNSSSQPPFHATPNQTVPIVTKQNQEYYNMNHSTGTNHVTSNGEAIYANGCVRLPSTSSSSTCQNPPSNPTTRGSTSSQHTSSLVALPEDTALRLSTSEQPFALQPAPMSRKEMVIRRRVNSDMPTTATYRVDDDDVILGNSPRRNSENTNYENNDVMDVVTSESFPRRHRVTYSKKTQQVKISPSASRSPNPETKPQDGASVPSDLSPSVLDPLEVATSLLRSDCDPLLTPGSKSSGIGSLNGNGESSCSNNPPPPIPPPLSDPWKRRPLKFNKRRFSPPVPHTARDYVNTVNASMDVSGTPLPATAVGGMHFNFDFVHLGFPRPSRSNDRSKLNYVPVEIFKGGEGDYNCGASSASSGIPGTPRTPKTPKTPLSNHQSTDYAIIDHNKTRALSNAHRARQRERKSFRHAKPETAVMNAV